MFQPSGFHALFGSPTSPLSETGIEGHAVLGPGISRLHQHLGNLRTFTERTHILDRYFVNHLTQKTQPDPILQALQLLSADGQTTQTNTVGNVAQLVKIIP